MTVSWLNSLIFGIIPLGQLYLRIFKLNGSLDKKWLLFPLFMFPPFQLLATIMMKFGYVKNGRGGKPYDYFIFIPIITKIILSYVLSYLEDEYDLSTSLIVLIDLIVTLLACLIPFYIRTIKTCNKFTIENFWNAFSQGSFVQTVSEIFTWGAGYIPVLGFIITLLEKIPVVGPLIPWSISYSTGYIVFNMLNNDDPKSFCLKSNYKFFFSFIAILITTGVKYVEHFMDS